MNIICFLFSVSMLRLLVGFLRIIYSSLNKKKNSAPALIFYLRAEFPYNRNE